MRAWPDVMEKLYPFTGRWFIPYRLRLIRVFNFTFRVFRLGGIRVIHSGDTRAAICPQRKTARTKSVAPNL